MSLCSRLGLIDPSKRLARAPHGRHAGRVLPRGGFAHSPSYKPGEQPGFLSSACSRLTPSRLSQELHKPQEALNNDDLYLWINRSEDKKHFRHLLSGRRGFTNVAQFSSVDSQKPRNSSRVTAGQGSMQWCWTNGPLHSQDLLHLGSMIESKRHHTAAKFVCALSKIKSEKRWYYAISLQNVQRWPRSW